MVLFVRKEKVEVVFAGLGNPGGEYESTKHNVGFRALDAFAAQYFRGQIFTKKIGSLVLRGKFKGHEVLLVKPQQFMNLSGQSLKWVSRKYPADDIVVIYDDMDLPPGRIRLAHSGGSAGHKGLQSIIDTMRSDEIKRIRIGIGGRGDMEGGDYVLTPFTGEDAEKVESSINTTVKAMESILEGGFDRAMNTYNRKDIDDVVSGKTGNEKKDQRGENTNSD